MVTLVFRSKPIAEAEMSNRLIMRMSYDFVQLLLPFACVLFYESSTVNIVTSTCPIDYIVIANVLEVSKLTLTNLHHFH